MAEMSHYHWVDFREAGQIHMCSKVNIDALPEQHIRRGISNIASMVRNLWGYALYITRCTAKSCARGASTTVSSISMVSIPD